MKILGYISITLGFLAGSLVVVMDKEKVPWNYFIPALVAGAVGVVLVRTGEGRKSRSAGKLSANMQSVESSLGSIVEKITRLNDRKGSINTYDVRHEIDKLFIEDLTSFVDSRQSIAQVHGLAAYADVMSCFAAGERYLNRVWSASADGYIDEVNAYLEKSREQFVESHQKILQLKAAAPASQPAPENTEAVS